MTKLKLCMMFKSDVLETTVKDYLVRDRNFEIDCPPHAADVIIFDALPPQAQLKKTHTENPKAQIVCFLETTEKLCNLAFSVKTLIKPFRLQTLQEHLENLVPQSVIHFHQFTLYPAQRRLVFQDSAPITLTEKEVELLTCLHGEQSTPLSRESLLKKVWGYGDGITTHTIETHIYKLKQKLKTLSKKEVIMLNKEGYFLKPDTTP